MGELTELARTFLAENPLFNQFVIRRKGKQRQVMAPNAAMRKLHAGFSALLRSCASPMGTRDPFQSAFGALSGLSFLENACSHLEHRYFYQLDITNAFPNTKLEPLARILGTYGWLGTEEEVLEFLVTYCKGSRGGLAVGAPSSPLLFDLYCIHLIDPVLRAIFPRGTYTRYLDDFTFSSDEPIPAEMRKRIRSVVERAGFQVSHPKSSVTDRLVRRVTLTGVVITRKGKIRPTDEFVSKVSALLALQPGSGDLDIHHLQGLLAHLSQFGKQNSWIVDEEVCRLSKRLKSVIDLQCGDRQNSATAKDTPRRGRVSEKELDAIRSSVSVQNLIVAMLGLEVQENKRFAICCPYHKERTPSFTVNNEHGFYHCFGCGAHGDIFQFVMNMRKLPFRQAVQFVIDNFVTEHSAP